ncbi:MAG: hypothetical protein HC911_13000 [Chloroflexaceae bacterium]|nr:hypothetical protein [Chloroflexaceae bacterium]
MTSLATLAEHRDDLLKAELAALLHNLGKLSSEFVEKHTMPAASTDFHYQYITGVLAEWWTMHEASLDPVVRHRVRDVCTQASHSDTYDFLNDAVHGHNVRAWFQERCIKLPSPLDDKAYAFGEFSEFHKGWKPDDSNSRLLEIYRDANGNGFVPQAIRLIHTAHDAASGGEKQDAGNQQKQTRFSTPEVVYVTSAYGREAQIELSDLDTQRESLIASVLNSAIPYREQYDNAEQSLRVGLGDTQRPINDVSLWDLSAATAALFKAAAAAAVLTGSIPSVAVARWRLLAISFDGLGFWGQAHHIPDLLARREAVRKGLDAVRALLEVTYPLGNEIYRDEYGSVFVVPDCAELCSLPAEHGQSLEHHLLAAFNSSDATGVAGELQPQLHLSEPYVGKQIKLAQVLQQRSRTNHADLKHIEQAWGDPRTPANAPICTVCGVRPVGYPPHWATSKKAAERNLCCVCLARRGRRAEGWVAKITDTTSGNALQHTIWTDEVADQHGRLALIVGRFELDGWLDGTLIATLQKSASFARIQRCWRTTRTFWDEVEQTTIPQTLADKQEVRWTIKPDNAATLALGHYHAYELDVQGRHLSVCWDPDRKLFWTTDNLAYIGKLLPEQAGSEDPLQRIRKAVAGQNLNIYEPGGYGQARALKLVAENCTIAEAQSYTPYIPLVTEPAIFLALVPASHALAVATAIKAKYDSEMGRVKDRLPLHLGIIFAPRRTPMRALLDAGRTMLKFPFAWEEWHVDVATKDPAQPYHHVTLTRNGQSLTWHYPAKMGDGTTSDQWYPYLLTTDPQQPQQALAATDYRHVEELCEGDTVYIRPSRFDFEFLDTTGRRFALHDNQAGRRSDSRTRPICWMTSAALRIGGLPCGC